MPPEHPLRRMQDDGAARRVRRIFLIVLALNLFVALTKAIFGIIAGSVSMVADALHPGVDSFSNIVDTHCKSRPSS